MSSNKSGRVLVAAVLAASLSLTLAGPAEAAGGREVAQGPLERLTAWFAGLWMPETAPLDGATQTPPTEEDEDPEGCRGDYSACVDPNGIILPPPPTP